MRKIIRYNNVFIENAASVVGQKEAEGPLAAEFDLIDTDAYFGKPTFEKGESEMVRLTVNLLLSKCGRKPQDIDAVLCGDLVNQCASSSFGVKTFGIPHVGIYGACSTCAEGLALGGILIDSGGFEKVISLASSHFCTAERQYRFPLEYGNQRTPTAQNTVTGCGAFMLTGNRSVMRLESSLFGIISDNGVTDQNNMGAAMATAAVDTLSRYFYESNESIDDFDIIATGDLGYEGHGIATELLSHHGIKTDERFTDCGMLIYDAKRQDMHAGGSGCGCMATVLAGYFNRQMQQKQINRIMLIGTGALLNPNTVLQGESIPSVAHLVTIRREDI